MNFPDSSHLVRLQEILGDWLRAPAAVMVGAGFSLNAEPLPGTTTKFPDWRGLVRPLFNELSPLPEDAAPAEVHTREQRFQAADPTHIASAYQKYFDHEKLDTLIRTTIPDASYAPGALHRLLLQLPWADVFTTNYDTLLERTPLLVNPYTLVTKAADFPNAKPPRIIKLHGSLPSQTPFIISEKDYAEYSGTHEAFANCVRQSLLENALVLIGFSGNDPNFLTWMRWIEKNLPDDHAPVYLVGRLSADELERTLLASRGVTPLDLSPAFPDSTHAETIKHFLDLMTERRPRHDIWPKLEPVRSSPVFRLSFPQVPESVDVGPQEPVMLPDTPARVRERWSFERQRYPGWIVAPEHSRVQLWQETRPWITLLASLADDHSPTDRLLLFRELNWRLETGMVPLPAVVIEPFTRALDDVFAAVSRPSSSALGAPAPEQPQDAGIADAWLEIAYGLLRQARESFDLRRWRRLKARIAAVNKVQDRQPDRLLYESALLALWSLNRRAAQKILEDWQPSAGWPLASIWKVGILAELGHYEPARKSLQSALTEINALSITRRQDLEMLSCEAWCLYLLVFVESAPTGLNRTESRPQFADRRRVFKEWDCDPKHHEEYFEHALAPVPPHSDEIQQEIRERLLWRYNREDIVAPFMAAAAFLRTLERVGIPLRALGLIDIPMVRNGLDQACRWLTPVMGYWVPGLLVRGHKSSDVQKLMATPYVASMEASLAERVYRRCFRVMKWELPLLERKGDMRSRARVLVDVLSGLAFRMDESTLRKSFSFALESHQLTYLRHDSMRHDLLDPWFRALFHAADAAVIWEWLPGLLRPRLFDDTIYVGVGGTTRLWPDPMRHFPTARLAAARSRGHAQAPCVEIHAAADSLVEQTSTDSPETRRRAVERLIILHELGLLSPDQEQDLARILWTGATDKGLPRRPGVPAAAVLRLPALPTIDAPSLLKDYILALEYQAPPREADGRDPSWFAWSEPPFLREASLASKSMIPPAGDSVVIEWSTQQARQLYTKARSWWPDYKRALERTRESRSGVTAIARNATSLGYFLAGVVLPPRAPAVADVRELFEWLADIHEAGMYPTVALPYVLLHCREKLAAIATTIADDLELDNSEAVSAAAEAVRHWAHLAASSEIPALPPDLMTLLVNRVAFRLPHGIRSCLVQVSCILTEQPGQFAASQSQLLAASLTSWNQASVVPAPQQARAGFDEADRPELRTLVSGLGYALGSWYAVSSPRLPEPREIGWWRNLCARDLLPEVRRAFRFGN